MYKLIDRQGTGTKADRIYQTKEEVREDLASFHSADISDTDKMTLDDLLEIGDWELVEAPLKATDGERDEQHTKWEKEAKNYLKRLTKDKNVSIDYDKKTIEIQNSEGDKTLYTITIN